MTKFTNKQDGRPSFQFYPNDWLSSPDLNSCSLEAQGLWIKMLCIMYQSPERGVLLLSSGKQIDSKMLAKLCGVDEQKISKLLQELEEAGVFSRLDNQAIYNRRMYREWKISKARSEAGRLGGLKQIESKKEANVKQIAEEEEEKEIEKEILYKKEEGDCKEGEEKKINKKEVEEFFEKFWETYPKRGGKRVGKKECLDFIKQKIKQEDWDSLLRATENYAQSDESKDGFARDPIRFLKKDYWRDWVDVENKKQEKFTKFNEDTEFICDDCKRVKLKIERQYGEDGKGRCKECYKKYIENWEKENEEEMKRCKKQWQNMTEEEKQKHIELRKRFGLPIPEWMEGGEGE